MKHTYRLAFLVGSLTMLSACCCADVGIDPPQPHQYEHVAPIDNEQLQ